MPVNNSLFQSNTDLLAINENRYEGISPVNVDNVNDTISIDDNSITADKMKSGETLPVNISGNANTATTADTATTASDYAAEGGIADALAGKLGTTGNASDTTSTFTKDSDDTSDMASGSKLSAIFTAISNFFASLKALAFKDKASYNDLSSGVQSSLDKADTALQYNATSQSSGSYPLLTNDSGTGKYNSYITLDMASREILAGNSTPNLATPSAPYSNDITMRTVTSNVTYTPLYHKPTKDMYVLVINGGSAATSVIYGSSSSTSTKSLAPGYMVILLYTTSNETWSLVAEPALSDGTYPNMTVGTAQKLRASNSSTAELTYQRNSIADTGNLPDIPNITGSLLSTYISTYLDNEDTQILYNRNGRESLLLLSRGSSANYWGAIAASFNDNYLRIGHNSNDSANVFTKAWAGYSDTAGNTYVFNKDNPTNGKYYGLLNFTNYTGTMDRSYCGCMLSFCTRSNNTQNIKGIIVISPYEWDRTTIVAKTIIFDTYANINGTLPVFYVRYTGNKNSFQLWANITGPNTYIELSVLHSGPYSASTLTDTSDTQPSNSTVCGLSRNVIVGTESNTSPVVTTSSTTTPVYVKSDGSLGACGVTERPVNSGASASLYNNTTFLETSYSMNISNIVPSDTSKSHLLIIRNMSQGSVTITVQGSITHTIPGGRTAMFIWAASTSTPYWSAIGNLSFS